MQSPWLLLLVLACGAAALSDIKATANSNVEAAVEIIGEPAWSAADCTLRLPALKVAPTSVTPILGEFDNGTIASRRLEFDATPTSMVITLPGCTQPASVVVYCRACSQGVSAIRGAALGTVSLAADGPTITLVLEGAALPAATAAVSRQRRKLLATCGPTMNLGGRDIPFENCVPIDPSLLLYYTLTNSTLGGGATFSGGILADASVATGRWNAFGWNINNVPNMVGSNAVIMFPDASSSSGATVTGIELISTSADLINQAFGSVPLGVDSSAALNADGSIAATFTFDLPLMPEDYATPGNFAYVYVIAGPLEGTTLLSHFPDPKSDFGGTKSLALASGGAPTPLPNSPPPLGLSQPPPDILPPPPPDAPPPPPDPTDFPSPPPPQDQTTTMASPPPPADSPPVDSPPPAPVDPTPTPTPMPDPVPEPPVELAPGPGVPVPAPGPDGQPNPIPILLPTKAPVGTNSKCAWRGRYYLESASCPGMFLAVSFNGCRSSLVSLGPRDRRAKWSLDGKAGDFNKIRSADRTDSCAMRFLAVGDYGKPKLSTQKNSDVAKWAILPITKKCSGGVNIRSPVQSNPYLAVRPDCNGFIWVKSPSNTAKWKPTRTS